MPLKILYVPWQKNYKKSNNNPRTLLWTHEIKTRFDIIPWNRKIYWAQTSEKNWFLLGGKNTKQFQISVAMRQ